MAGRGHALSLRGLRERVGTCKQPQPESDSTFQALSEGEAADKGILRFPGRLLSKTQS